jgi:hypothetical protein
MSAVEIVQEVLAAGGVLLLKGDRIHYQIPEQAAPLLNELRHHKADVLNLLRQREHRECLSRLMPFVEKRVWSPAGPGKLLLVRDYIVVALENGTKMRWYDPTVVIPYA